MLSKLVSQIVVFGTPLIMVCLLIAFIGLFIYFNKRIDRLSDRVNTLSDLVSVLQDLVSQKCAIQQQAPETKVVSVPLEDKIVVSDEEEEEEEEDDYVSTSSEDEEEDHTLSVMPDEEDEEEVITVTKVDTIQPIETIDTLDAVEPIDTLDTLDTLNAVEPIDTPDAVEPIDTLDTLETIEPHSDVGLIDDDVMSISSHPATVIPEPILEEICTNAVLKERFLSTNYRGYKVNQLRDLATDLHLIKDKDAAKLKKGELITFLDKTYVQLKN
jgi:hypothetical protein